MTIPSPSTIEKVLGFVDRPWKIAAVVILAGTGVVALTLWEKRAEIAEMVIHDLTHPQLKPEIFTNKFAAKIMDETHADGIVLAEVSFTNLYIRDIGGYLRGDPAWEPPANPRPLYFAERDPSLLIDLVEGRGGCRNIDAQDGDEERMLGRLGMTRRCFVGIPVLANIQVGALMLSWKIPLSAEAEAGALRVLNRSSGTLGTW